MGIDRVLMIDLDTAVRLLEGTKWKFYELVDPETIRLEVPKDKETLVIELPFNEKTELQLRSEGFIRQEIRPWRAF